MELQYKLLNKQLVEQVQGMRNTLREYRDEIVQLRAKLNEEKIESIRLRKKCTAVAKTNCFEFLEFLDPNSSVLPRLVIELGMGTPPASSATARQSSRLVEELRRSSSVIQTRRSFNAVSPIRSTTDMTDERDERAEVVEIVEIETTQTLRNATLAILEEEQEDNDEAMHYINERNYENFPRTVQDNRENSSQVSDDCTVIEDSVFPTNPSESEESAEGGRNYETSRNGVEEAEANSAQTIDESTIEHYAESPQTSDNCVQRRTLRDVTNTLAKATNDSSHSSQKGKKKGAEIIKHVTRGRGRPNSKTRTNESAQFDVDRDNTGANAPSIEEVRQNSHVQRQKEGSFRISIQDRSFPDAASSFSLTDITMVNFRVESSSTPRQTIRDKTRTSANTSKPPEQSSRPTRSCKPTSLVERSLAGKLRNETSEQSLGINRSRTRK